MLTYWKAWGAEERCRDLDKAVTADEPAGGCGLVYA